MAATDTLDVINWNLDWWGSGSPLNAATQVAKTRQLMQAINADVYALCEVVNVDSLNALTASLGTGAYGYYVSSYGSLAANTSSSQYAACQKLGFIYRKSRVRNITAKAMLAGSSTASYEFSSGRYPYLVKAEVLGNNGQWHDIIFIILHAKADADGTSCSRRINACKELKDSLDAYYPTADFLVLGDFNDDLDHTICSGGGATNYLYMVQDSAHYKSITLPLERSGAVSIDGYHTLIDNVIASDEMYHYYVPGSAQSLRTFVKAIVPNYDNQVSDHFPVRARYVLDAATSVSSGGAAFKTAVQISPNPVQARLQLLFYDGCRHTYSLLNVAGDIVMSGTINTGSASLDVEILPAGLYCLLLRNEAGAQIMQRLSIIH